MTDYAKGSCSRCAAWVPLASLVFVDGRYRCAGCALDLDAEAREREAARLREMGGDEFE